MATMEQAKKDTNGRPRRKIDFTETGIALFEAEMKEIATNCKKNLTSSNAID